MPKPAKSVGADSSGSWRVDETFIKIRGQLMYLYRAVDGQGNTVEFFLSRTRGIAGGEGILSQGTEASSGATQHHLGWPPAEP